MRTFAKKYQVWTLNAGETPSYSFEEYDSLAECVSGEHNSAWYVTKRVQVNVSDAEENLSAPTFPHHEPGQRGSIAAPTRTESVADEETTAALDAYLRGEPPAAIS